MAITWPVVTIDYEASSLEPTGYPIEVGVVTWSGPGQPLYRWSTLIQPTREWLDHGHWSPASRKVHGIRRDELQSGLSPLTVANALNQALRNVGTAWCDGGPYDAFWTRRLFSAAGVTSAFVLGDWPRLTSGNKPLSNRIADYLIATPAAHRAGADAERLLRSLTSAMEADPGEARDLSRHITLLANLGLPQEQLGAMPATRDGANRR